VKQGGTLSYNKVCGIEDFDYMELRELIRMSFQWEAERWGPDFPTGREERKQWEVAMALRGLRDFGAVRPDAEILAVGAGTEATIYWLTNYVRRVFATDLYADAGDWGMTARSSMLIDPGRHASGRWNPRRLVVQHMNALDLRFEDACFDGVFSSSSIEHFGSSDDVRQAVREIYRVLRPGAIACISTEFRLRGEGGMDGVMLFDAWELQRDIISEVAWRLVSPLDLTVSVATRRSEVPFEEAVADASTEAGYRRFPHLVLQHGDLAWTSVHLVLRKGETFTKPSGR
jgi:SAM-dependent methyltransferase